LFKEGRKGKKKRATPRNCRPGVSAWKTRFVASKKKESDKKKKKQPIGWKTTNIKKQPTTKKRF